jgi:hypothetical protein
MTRPILPANQLPKINQPEKLDDILDPFADYIRSTFNCHRVGIIQSFNATTQRAVVQLVDVLRKNTYQGQQLITPAPLVDVPVFIPYGSNGGVNLMIKSGLECLVIFNDRDLQNWKQTGGINTPATYRMHDITDGVCLIGIKSNPKAISEYDNATNGLSYFNDAGTLQGRVKVDNKVEIANVAQNLKDLIANLMNILQNLKTVNGADQYSIDPTTASNLATLATNFNQLLK